MLAISVLKRFGGSTILENNIVQTIGSAGESVAAGVVFTVPALIFFGERGSGYFNYFHVVDAALTSPHTAAANGSGSLVWCAHDDDPSRVLAFAGTDSGRPRMTLDVDS